MAGDTMAIPLPYCDAAESVPPDEADDIEQIVEILVQRLRQHFETAGVYQRDVHVKGHGCAQAEFRVLTDLPPALSQGLFARAHSYPATVRFSNSAPFVQSDLLPDGRGLAIQVRDVPSEGLSCPSGSPPTQDFLMANNPTFIARDVKDYRRFEEARLRARDQPVLLGSLLASGMWNPIRGRWREVLAAARVAAQRPSHPASYTYFSMVPIRFGEYIAKYRVTPTAVRLPSLLRQVAWLATRPHAMRRMLEETLRRQELLFEFQVQLRTRERSMPIEDATIAWPESESPYRTVAHLVLPRQDLSSLPQQQECEGCSFNVWNALVEHRPLGGINRLRRRIYAISAACRRHSDVAGDDTNCRADGRRPKISN